MKSKLSGLFKVGSAAVLGVWLVFQTVTLLATEFQAKVGAQSGDLGRQVLAFLPNEAVDPRWRQRDVGVPDRRAAHRNVPETWSGQAIF